MFMKPWQTIPAALLIAAPFVASPAQAPDFSVTQAISFPFVTEIAAAPTGSRVAFVMIDHGVRNIYVAEGPAFAPRKVTAYTDDDGQELTNLSLSADGRMVVYTRGGDHGSNWPAEGGLQPDPTSSPVQPHVEIFAVPFAGGAAPKLLGQGDDPTISPRGDRVIYAVNGQIWSVSLEGGTAGKRLFFDRGRDMMPQFSPDGSRLAYVSNRGDHNLVGIYESDSVPLRWLAPSTNRDLWPRWSPDGKSIAFVRVAGAGGPSLAILQQHPNPYRIMVADVATGAGRTVWKSPNTLHGSLPTSEGSANLHWAAGNRLVFMSDIDGWPHLYSIAAAGGSPVLLTPGKFMCEYIDISSSGRSLVYSANTGPLNDDVDRRHLFIVDVDGGSKPRQLVPGSGIEAEPVFTGDESAVVFAGGSAQMPMLPTMVPTSGGEAKTLITASADFPGDRFVTPKMVIFHAPDGTEVHGQLFERPGSGKHPAVVFVHGGPPRQMLLGFNYMWYYSNGYAVNQYLANHGYVVLSVNYRLGIGYGHDFHHPPHASAQGAAEYEDVKAGGLYLRSLPQVDAKRIGIWGGSYGGFLTAMALARNSDIFATGVDLHGVHDWTTERARGMLDRERYEQAPDVKQALEVAWKSSPVSSMATWRSPVLLIQGDDDRNVRFHQTVDLARRLDARGVPYSELVIPDEIHDFLRYATWTQVDQATVSWFDQHFMSSGSSAVLSGSPRRK